MLKWAGAMNKKRKSGAQISGDPRKRQANKSKKESGSTQRPSLSSNNTGIDLNDDDLDESEILQDEFILAYPEWEKSGDWAITSQIIRAFDGFILWRKVAKGEPFDIKECFERNKITDLADDATNFLKSKNLYPIK